MEHHWFPLVAVKHREELTIWLEKHPVATAISFHPAWEVFVIEPDSGARCGVHTLMSLAPALGMKVIDLAQNDSFELLRSLFHQHTKPRCDPIRWGLGRSGQLVKNLTEELLKHGIPLIAQEAKKGSWHQIINALNHRQPYSSRCLATPNSNFFCLGLTVPLLSLNSKPWSSIMQICRNLTLLSMTSPSRLPTDDRCVFPPILCRCSLPTCLGGCLGVDVCLGGGSCRFCGQPLDGKRQHANSCMAGWSI